MGLNWNGAFEDRETFPPASQHFLLYFFNHQTEILNHRETLTLKSRSVSEYFSYLIQTWPPISGHHHTSIFPSKTTSLSKFHFVSLCFYFLGFLFFIFFEIGSVLFLWFLLSKQLLDQEEVDVVHPLDKEKGITLEDFKHIKMHMANCILSLSLSLSHFCWVAFNF